VRSARHAQSLVPSGSSTVTRHILGLFNCLSCIWEGWRFAYGLDTAFGVDRDAVSLEEFAAGLASALHCCWLVYVFKQVARPAPGSNIIDPSDVSFRIITSRPISKFAGKMGFSCFK
jgi:hypothetical protein